MRQPSIVIHKGRKEEKYELYVEDYVISFLKEKRDMPNAEEILFYGCREKGGRQYTIYGAGLDRHLTVFDKYDLLEEVGCRLTHADPVFLVREGKSTYEIKGYKVFYYENEEMQNYLIHQDMEQKENASFSDTYSTVRKDMARHPAGRPAGQNPHYLISLQLGLVFVVLVAIVINSSNSYDKMEQLNQSAEEVFFVMENQETEELPEAEEVQNDIIVERDTSGYHTLQDSVLQENEMQEQKDLEADAAENQPVVSRTETEEGKEQAASSEITEAQQEESLPEERVTEEPADVAEGAGAAEGAYAEEQAADASQETEADAGDEGLESTATEEGVEALSRNVARYYEVERGDTLYMISKKIYGDTSHVKRICEINQITDPDNICYGQKIILP